MSFAFRSGFRAHKVKADTVASELTRIEEKEGKLTASAVFEAARPEDAELHAEFEWRPAEAITQLGLIRARELIRAVVVLPEQDTTDPPSRVWVHVEDVEKPAGPGEYQRIADIVERQDDYQRALAALQRKIDSASEAMRELQLAAEASENRDRLAEIGLAVQAFGAVREALAVLAR